MASSSSVRVIEGDFSAPSKASVALVAARFNHFVVDSLVEGAIDGLNRHGIGPDSITLVKVPGAVEISVAVNRLARSGKFDAVIALGAVIRGSTPHFDYVCGEVNRGCGAASQATGVPVIFGVITTENIEQAIERSGTKAGNKGFEAALSAVEMINLGRALSAAGL